MTTIRTAFVLGGGGRWGAVEVGMLDALTAAGITPDLVIGCSIGAINGAVFAADPTAKGVDRLRAIWTQVAEDDPFGARIDERVRSLVSMRNAVHPNDGLAELITSNLTATTFEDLVVPFECVAAVIERATERWFTSGLLLPALLASSAIPVLLPPVEIDGEHHYDGGLVNSIPIDRAVDRGATEIFVLQVGRVEEALEPPRRLDQAALVALELARRHRYATALATPPHGVTIHVLPTGDPVRMGDPRQLRWRDTRDALERMDTAQVAAAAYLAENHLGRAPGEPVAPVKAGG